MDDPGLDPGRHADALRGLARLNRWSNSPGILWPALESLAKETGGIRVLDVACGAGDVAIELRGRAALAGLDIRVDGCDRSSAAVGHASEAAARAQSDARFFVHDALRGELPGGYDAVVCSLFLHHLTRDDAVTFLRSAGAAAGRLVAVSDLVRSTPGLALASVATALLTRSDVVHTDGPRSVRAAFTVREAAGLAEAAGLKGAAVTPRFPCRFLISWRKE